MFQGIVLLVAALSLVISIAEQSLHGLSSYAVLSSSLANAFKARVHLQPHSSYALPCCEKDVSCFRAAVSAESAM